MKQAKVISAIFLFIIVLVGHLLMPASQVVAQDTPSAKTEALPANASPEEVDAYLAGLTDTEARQVLAQKLKPSSGAVSAGSTASDQKRANTNIGTLVIGAAGATDAVLKRIGSIFSTTSGGSGHWDAALTKLTGGKGGGHLLRTLFGVMVIIGLGLVLRWLFRRSTADIEKNILNAVRLGRLQFFGRVLSRMILEILGIVIFVAATFLPFALFYKMGKPDFVIVSAFLVVSYYVLIISFAAKTILAPRAPRLRLFPMADQDAAFLYNWLVRITILAGAVGVVSSIMHEFGITREMYLLIRSSAGVVVVLALLIMIWQSRHRVAEALRPAAGDGPEAPHSFQVAFARNWVIFAALYVIIMGAVWIGNVLLTGKATILNLIISIFLIPAFIGLDQWAQRLLKVASGELPEIVDLSEDDRSGTQEGKQIEGKGDIKHYVPVIKRLFRVVLITFLI